MRRILSVVCSPSLDLVLVVDMVTPSIGTLESILPHVDQSESLDMYSFQSIILPSDEELLEAMVKVNEHSSLSVSSSLKNDTQSIVHFPVSTHEHSSFSVSSSLKNETDPPPIESSLLLDIVLEPSFPPPVSIDPLPSSLSGEPIPISNQESNRVQKKSRWMK
jgi:hypothetical protein